MTLLDLFPLALLVERYALGVGLIGAVVAAVGVYGIRRFRQANRVIDKAREDLVRARLIEERNRLEDRDLFAVAAHCDGKEFRP